MSTLRILLAAGCSLILGRAATPPAATTLTATDSGCYASDAQTASFVNPRLDNYAVGWDPKDFSDAVLLRNFFVSTLNLYMPGPPSRGYESFEATESYQLTNTSTSISDLTGIYAPGSSAGQTIFSTLGTGTVFASTTVSAGDQGTTIQIALNAAAWRS